MPQLLPFAPTRSLEVVEARVARRTRAKRLVIALGAGVVALLAIMPAASHAQAPVVDANAVPAAPAPAAPGSTMAPTPGATMPAAPPAGSMPPATQPAPGMAAPAAAAPPRPPLTVPPPPPPRDAMVQRTAGSVAYICGGVAEDEQVALQSQARKYNMSLLFTQGARGEYLSDVDVKLTRGGRDVASFVADGPRCLLKAPSGTYNVSATYQGRTRTATVSTGSKNAQMRW